MDEGYKEERTNSRQPEKSEGKPMGHLLLHLPIRFFQHVRKLLGAIISSHVPNLDV